MCGEEETINLIMFESPDTTNMFTVASILSPRGFPLTSLFSNMNYLF